MLRCTAPKARVAIASSWQSSGSGFESPRSVGIGYFW